MTEPGTSHGDGQPDAEPETLRCARHPDTETSLRCGKCGTPICPRCMVETPVGARCKTCADSRKLPVYSVSGLYYLRAIGAGLGAGIAVGLVWGLIYLYLPSYFFTILLSAGAGWLIGEAVSRAVNRKRSVGLAIIGGLAVLLAFGVALFMELNRIGYIDLSWVKIGFYFISAGVGIYIAVSRLH